MNFNSSFPSANNSPVGVVSRYSRRPKMGICAAQTLWFWGLTYSVQVPRLRRSLCHRSASRTAPLNKYSAKVRPGVVYAALCPGNIGGCLLFKFMSSIYKAAMFFRSHLTISPLIMLWQWLVLHKLLNGI
jgi:hypothetical protein